MYKVFTDNTFKVVCVALICGRSKRLFSFEVLFPVIQRGGMFCDCDGSVWRCGLVATLCITSQVIPPRESAMTSHMMPQYLVICAYEWREAMTYDGKVCRFSVFNRTRRLRCLCSLLGRCGMQGSYPSSFLSLLPR